MESLYKIKKDSPLEELVKINLKLKFKGVVEMREQTSKIVTLVGGGNEPGFSKNKGLIWDYDSKKCLGELVCPKDIHSVKMDANYIITIAEDYLFIYNYNCKEIFKTKTCKKIF
jgi:hypothetical protein